MRRLLLASLTSALLVFLASGSGSLLRALAQAPAPGTPPRSAANEPPAATKAPAANEDGHSFVDIVLAGGWVGHTIILLSIVALALVIDHVWTIRASVLMPPQLADKVQAALAAGQYGQADQFCRLQPSVLAAVLEAGIAEVDGGWPASEKAMEDMIAEQSARLFRKIEYLSVIGNIAPMLGLLGTVIGMVVAFRQVAITQGAARAADLAEGIYLALVTTVEGLIVAIPALGVFAIFRNRVDQLVAEVAYASQHAFGPIRHTRAPTSSRKTVIAPPPLEGRG